MVGFLLKPRCRKFAQLQKVFDELPTQIFIVTETTEISVFFVIFAAVFILLAIALAIIWNLLLW